MNELKKVKITPVSVATSLNSAACIKLNEKLINDLHKEYKKQVNLKEKKELAIIIKALYETNINSLQLTLNAAKVYLRAQEVNLKVRGL